ncbi:MAG TPA: hypothetical protein VGL21_18485 [Jatrophihabitantaceae bacterium]
MSVGPPQAWQEHWFEHDQLLQLAGATSDVAVYFDRDVPGDTARWLVPYLDDAWRYTKQTYGDFGPDPLLYSIFHQGRYAGGHPSSYQDPSHDNRNVTDCGPGPYREGDSHPYEMVTHEISHVVEGANNGAWGSPAFPIWGDSKWAEFFIHDVYTALGLDQWATDVARNFDRNSDDFPRRGTHWFRDWWRPLRTGTGDSPQVMVRFFRLLAEHFPRGADTHYVRDLTWGEYLHFTSGAAGGDVTDLARRAFGWPRRWSRELDRARADFPAITY